MISPKNLTLVAFVSLQCLLGSTVNADLLPKHKVLQELVDTIPDETVNEDVHHLMNEGQYHEAGSMLSDFLDWYISSIPDNEHKAALLNKKEEIDDFLESELDQMYDEQDNWLNKLSELSAPEDNYSPEPVSHVKATKVDKKSVSHIPYDKHDDRLNKVSELSDPKDKVKATKVDKKSVSHIPYDKHDDRLNKVSEHSDPKYKVKATKVDKKAVSHIPESGSEEREMPRIRRPEQPDVFSHPPVLMPIVAPNGADLVPLKEDETATAELTDEGASGDVLDGFKQEWQDERVNESLKDDIAVILDKLAASQRSIDDMITKLGYNDLP